MNRKLIGWIIFVVLVLVIIGVITFNKSKTQNLADQQEGITIQDPQAADNTLATADLSSSDQDFTAIDEGLEGLE